VIVSNRARARVDKSVKPLRVEKCHADAVNDVQFNVRAVDGVAKVGTEP
jgi:hypothetical protein